MAVENLTRTPRLELDLSPADRAGLNHLASEFGVSPECLAKLAIAEKLSRAGIHEFYLDFQRKPVNG